MTNDEWNAFLNFKSDFKSHVEKWSAISERLFPLQKAAATKDTPEYPLETAVVYNRSLDDVTKDDEIHLIVIGDNPGKDEQRLKNNRYLVGQAGKIAEGYFKRNPELHIDFRKNSVILNKTPVHTAKTAHLKYLLKNGDDEIKTLIEESQIYMAKKTAALHKSLKSTQLWLVGYGELKANGIFSLYRNALKDSYSDSNDWERVFVFQHFSMNRFSIDLASFQDKNPSLSLKDAIEVLGKHYRTRIFEGSEKE